jgi:hypothetical protein
MEIISDLLFTMTIICCPLGSADTQLAPCRPGRFSLAKFDLDY